MSWHHPDLYFFLFLLAGLATFLAIIYECIQKFGRKPPVVEPRPTEDEKAVDPPLLPQHPPSPQKYLKMAKPLDGLQRDRPVEQFSGLCESVKDAPPKEQARRVREHFGIVGGARPKNYPPSAKRT